jgi:hypothetical protein
MKVPYDRIGGTPSKEEGRRFQIHRLG